MAEKIRDIAHREGSLDAPQRHPLEWKTPEFYDEAELNAELTRVFDVCHGCRRCFSLCNAFPTLFNLVNASESGELDAVPVARYAEVVDQCYLCDLCFMTKCPYVPPHSLNIDFPHLMLRAKALKFRKQGARFRDRLLSSTDALGRIASIPVVAQAINAVNKSRPARAALESVLGIDRRRELPPYAPAKFRSSARPAKGHHPRDGERTPGKIAVFATCYVNFNEPGIGHDLLAILDHNKIPTTLVSAEACCGMPKLELGDLESCERLMRKNIPILAAAAREGYAILAPVPSCALMFKQELPLLFPDDAGVQLVAGSMFDPFEYLSMRHKDGLLRTDFKQSLGRVAYHAPCHLRVQNMGQRTREVLALIPETEIRIIERCSGHDGTWGVKREYFEQSMRIGKHVFQQMYSVEPNYVSSDCPIAIRHIVQGISELPEKARSTGVHPLGLMRIAYGLAQ